jgi:hypothetical protein
MSKGRGAECLGLFYCPYSLIYRHHIQQTFLQPSARHGKILSGSFHLSLHFSMAAPCMVSLWFLMILEVQGENQGSILNGQSKYISESQKNARTENLVQNWCSSRAKRIILHCSHHKTLMVFVSNYSLV